MQLKYFVSFVPSVLAAVHTVDVGKSGLSFSPQTVNASPGDEVVFTLFNPHDVAQSTFDKPCAPSGFYSGTYANAQNGALRYVLTINNTDPIYFYCTVPGHCSAGMVGGINVPTSGNTISAYADEAKNAQGGSRPSGVEGGVLVSAASASALESGGSASSTASPTGSESSSASATGSVTGASSAATATHTGTGTSTPGASGATGASASSSPTGAAPSLEQGVSGMLAVAGAMAAWLL